MHTKNPPIFVFPFSLVLADEVTKMFIFIFCKVLPVLPCKRKPQKITQPKLPKTKNELTKICNEPGNNNGKTICLIYFVMLETC